MLQHEVDAHSAGTADIGEHACDALNCTRVFKLAKDLEKHFAAVHSHVELLVAVDAQYFLCCCNRMFTQFGYLTQHHRDSHKQINGQSESRSPSNSSYMCSCLQKFDDFHNLRDHHGSVHESTTTAVHPYECTNCKCSFRSDGALQDHMVSE